MDGRRAAILGLAVAVALTSQFYRGAHAVIAPDLMRELAIAPGVLATLTGVYFLASAVAQIPSGALFDRFGPRAVVPALLAIAGLGAAVFASAEDAGGLILGRVLMGTGYGAVVMGCFVLVSRWFDPVRFAVLASVILGFSQTGSLLGTAPMAAASVWLGWRGAFWAIAGAPMLIALAFLVLARNGPGPRAPGPPERLGAMLGGILEILRTRALWPIFAMAFCGYATIISVLGLWGAPYLHDVHGLGPVERGNVMLVMAAGLAAGQFASGFAARLLGSVKATMAGGAGIVALCLGVLALVPAPPLWLVATLFTMIGLAGGYTVLIIVHGRAFYPDRLAGRGMTMVNTFLMTGVAVIQLLTGLVLEAFPMQDGLTPPEAWRACFATLAVLLLVALGFYVTARDAPRPAPAAPAPARR